MDAKPRKMSYQRQLIQRDYREDVEEIQQATDIETLRNLALRLATELRQTSEHLQDWREGDLRYKR